MAKQYPQEHYHEAGHAVVGHSLGLRVRGIYIDQEGEGGGAPIECAACRSFVERAALRLAGMKAHEVYKQESTQPLGQSDNEQFLSQCSGLSNESREEIRMRGFELAGEKLAMYADKVKAVADHLIKHGRITESEFQALMQPKIVFLGI